MSRPARPVRWAVGGFVAAIIVVAAVVATVTVRLADQVAEEELRVEAEETSKLVQQAVVASLSQEPERSIAEHFDRVLLPQVEAGTLLRVKVWHNVADNRLRLVYSDLDEVIGSEKEIKPGRAELFGTDATLVLPVPDDAEHAFEYKPDGQVIEVFTSFSSGGDDYLLESYFMTTVSQKADRLQADLLPVVLGSVLAFALVVMPMTIVFAMRLGRTDRERLALLERAATEREEERRDLGQRLHDGVLQDLAGVSMALSSASQDGDPDLENVAEIVRGDIVKLRALLEDLVPADLAWHALGTALESLITDLFEPAVSVSLEVDTAGTVDDSVAVTTYRLARELLRNVAQHARARSVRVEVVLRGPDAVLVVTDDGGGFAPESLAASGHVGLRIIAHTVAMAGGTHTVESAPGTGTRVEVRLPLHQ